MTDDTKSILCGACKVEVEGPADPKPEDTFFCPSCGNSDTLKNVVASVHAFAQEAAARHLQESMRKAARGSKMLKFKGKPIPKRNHPFICDLEF